MSGIGELASNQPLLILAIVGILAAAAGWMVERDNPRFATGLRRGGYLAMLAAGLLLVGQAAEKASRSDAHMMLRDRPPLRVTGGETVIPMAADGHFWVEAQVNGVPVDLLVDTGATVTGLSRSVAQEAGVTSDPGRPPEETVTANGMIWVEKATVRSVRFGNIAIDNLEVGIPRDVDDDTNVIGMNLLSQLGSWRVEGNRLILKPKS